MNKFKYLITVGIIAGLADAAQAAFLEFQASLNGPSESPVNASAGIGSAYAFYDSASHLLGLNISFSGLTGVTTASHIHAPTSVPGTGLAGVATMTPTFSGFPLGVKSGAYVNTFDLTVTSNFNPAYVTLNGSVGASETALINAMIGGQAYLNIHTDLSPSGEIRGFFVQVPEVSSVAPWFLLTAGGLYALRRSHRNRS